MNNKHPNITNIADAEVRDQQHGKKFGFKARRLGLSAGGNAIGASYFEIEPGKQAFPNHFHSANEEAVFVLEGQGHVRIGKDECEIKTGDYIAFPVGPEHAHSIRNSSQAILKLLCISTMVPVEVVGYPDSDKILAVAAPKVSKGLASSNDAWVRLLVNNQPSVDYYEGEITD